MGRVKDKERILKAREKKESYTREYIRLSADFSTEPL